MTVSAAATPSVITVCVCVEAVFEVTLKTRERLSVDQLSMTHNTTAVTLSPLTTRYTQASWLVSLSLSFLLSLLLCVPTV